uniref:Uncharacterized protein n=1 Tax=Tetradesmus obliquus TaxID=3088 RepID=A0A383VYT8_TETOB|eukprot:jgi/Sobl393_1/18936/SZX69934.1
MRDSDDGAAGRRAEIYTYESNTLVYAMNWSVRADKRYRLAVGSFKEDTNNQVEIIQLDEENSRLVCDPALTFQHAYPPTKLMFIPDKAGVRPDLLATSGDHLRIWSIQDSAVVLDRLLTNNKQSEFCAPLTSFDWNDVDPKRLGTSSIDTTCTIWDIERGVVDTQLIAHDMEVHDIAWGGVGVFATASADGSVRVFDLRDKEHSTIIFEGPADTPLLRLGWNKQDPRYIATLVADSPKVVILDIRYPTVPITQLARHNGCVNALAWAPHSASHICTAGDDCQALIWDLSPLGQSAAGAAPSSAAAPAAAAADGGNNNIASSAAAAGAAAGAVGAAGAAGGPGSYNLDPILAYSGGAEINQLQWSTAQPDWVAVSFANKTQILRV